jgi:hypothetical protein
MVLPYRRSFTIANSTTTTTKNVSRGGRLSPIENEAIPPPPFMTRPLLVGGTRANGSLSLDPARRRSDRPCRSRGRRVLMRFADPLSDDF